MRSYLSTLAGLLLGLSACGDNLPGPPVILTAGDLVVSVRPWDGTFDVERGGVGA